MLQYTPFDPARESLKALSVPSHLKISTAEEFAKTIVNVGADMREVRSYLHSQYYALTHNPFEISRQEADAYASLYERYAVQGFGPHAKKIRELPHKGISADESKTIKGNLSNLAQLIPAELASTNSSIVEFGRLLAERLPEKAVPAGFVMASELLLYDLRQGVNGFTGKPIESKLVGQEPAIYAILSAHIPYLAEVATPAPFARAVRRFIGEVKESEKADRELRQDTAEPMQPDAKRIDQLLSFNPLGTAEAVTGDSYKGNEETTNLGLALMVANAQATKKALAAAGDTHFGSTLADHLAIAAELGFEIVLKETIKVPKDGTDSSGHYNESMYILWRKDGVLMVLESYIETSANKAHVYANWASYGESANAERLSGLNWAVYPVSHQVSIDAREGLRHQLAKYEAQGEFLPQWDVRPHMWPIFYAEERVAPKDRGSSEYFDKVREERLAKLPAHILAAITPTKAADFHNVLECAQRLGFRQVGEDTYSYKYNFSGSRLNEGRVKAFARDDGAIILVEEKLQSHKGTYGVTAASLLINWKPNDPENARQWKRFVGQDPIISDSGTVFINIDASNGLEYKLNGLQGHGVFVPQWEIRPQSFAIGDSYRHAHDKEYAAALLPAVSKLVAELPPAVKAMYEKARVAVLQESNI